MSFLSFPYGTTLTANMALISRNMFQPGLTTIAGAERESAEITTGVPQEPHQAGEVRPG